jgi:hypothetical protein
MTDALIHCVTCNDIKKAYAYAICLDRLADIDKREEALNIETNPDMKEVIVS